MGIFTGIDFMPFNAFERSALKATAPWFIRKICCYVPQSAEKQRKEYNYNAVYTIGNNISFSTNAYSCCGFV
ncbi:MAG: hypothetical protein MR413_05290 [Clostridia bacterium]|nr:hypothetical protein [Clostridia bacterium]